jgi:hypothetical protein
MDEEATRRRTVRNHALGAHAQAAVRVLLVRGNPTMRVTAPAELRKGLVEALGERRQDDLDVEIARPPSPRLRRNVSSAAAVMSDWRKSS